MSSSVDATSLTPRCAPVRSASGGRLTVRELEVRLRELTEQLRELRDQVAPSGTNLDEARACRAMVLEHTRARDAVLVITKDDEAFLDLDRHATSFPQDRTGRYAGFSLAESTSAIAHLEALRFAGYRYLLIPESGRWWLTSYPQFHTHLDATADVVDDQPGVGRLYRLGPQVRRIAVGSLVDALADRPVAVCDWSGGRVGRLDLPHVLFEPPPGDSLPYLDHTIDVVVVVDADSRLDEARRVARLAVVSVTDDGTPHIRPVGGPKAIATRVRVTSSDESWQRLVAAALAAGGITVTDTDAELVLAADPGHLPLPGCVRHARALLAADRSVGAVAVKLLDADGSIASAGDFMFADGSWESVGAGSFETSAPWHEYVRDTCAASGIVLIDGRALDELELPPGIDVRGISTALWDHGRRVLYQPAATAVRVAETDSSDAKPTGLRPTPARPQRPDVLDEQAWRTLLARDVPGSRLPEPRSRTRVASLATVSPRRRALLCSHRPPEIDRDRGSQRVDALLQFLLADGWDVTFLAQQTDGSPHYAHRLQQLGVEVHVGYDDAAAVITTGAFDLALLAFWEPSKPLLALCRKHSPATKVVVDSHDLNFLREARRLFGQGTALDGAFGPLVTRELNTYFESDLVLAVSEWEASWLSAFIGRDRVDVLPLAEDCGTYSGAPLAERSGMVFTGNFRHLPNGEAVEYLCHDIVPKLPTMLLGAHPIRIIGSRLHERVGNVAADMPAVQMIGWVPSIDPYLGSARVCVVPLLHGAGVKGKVLQAMAAGTPVVTTSIGAEGLELTDGVHAIVADDPDSFAEAVTVLLTDDRRWSELSNAGSELVAHRYDREQEGRDFRAIVERVLAAPPRRQLALREAGEATRGEYSATIDAARRAILERTEPGDAVAVVSRGDDDLVAIRGRRAWHFPRDRNGGWAGYHPADSAAAISHLESMRGWGLGFLAIPRPSFWWLDHYAEFVEHLEREYVRLVDNEEVVVFDVHERASLLDDVRLAPDETGRRDRVLVIGRHDGSRGGPPPALVAALDRSRLFDVSQRWSTVPGELDESGFEWVVEIDDLVTVSPGFLDAVISWQRVLDADVVQPTHREGPAAGPPVTERLRNCAARVVDGPTPLPVTSRRRGAPADRPVVLLDAVSVGLRAGLVAPADPVAYSTVHDVIGGDLDDQASIVVRSPMLTDSPRLSVVISTFERAELLRACLDGFCKQDLSTDDFEVVVVDDGSDDAGATAAVLEDFRWRLPMITAMASHAGRSAAKNLAIQLARAPIVLLFDDDDRPATDLVREHLAAHETEPDEAVAVLGFTSWAAELGFDPLRHYLTDVDKMLFAYGNLTDGQLLDWKGFWEGRLSAKRSLLVRHGLHDQRLSYSIDVELGWRLMAEGLRVRYRNSARSEMLRPIEFDSFCERIEAKGRAHARIAELHPDEEVRRYTKVDEFATWTADDERALRAWIAEIERYAAEIGNPATADHLRLPDLYRTYRQVFRAFNHRGVAGGRNDTMPRRIRPGTPSVTAVVRASEQHPDGTPDEPLLTVTIPMYSLTEELAAMGAATVERLWEVSTLPFEVVVVDNGSPFIKPLRARVEQFAENRGVATAWNTGVSLARADVVAILNSDCRVEPGWDEALYEAATSGRLVAFPYTDHGDGLGYRQPDQAGTAGWCFMVSKSVYEEIGPFDERFNPAYCEDTDYWHRAWELGIGLTPVPAARVSHARRTTASKDPHWEWLLQSGRYKYGWKHGVDPHRAPPYYHREIVEYHGSVERAGR